MDVRIVTTELILIGYSLRESSYPTGTPPLSRTRARIREGGGNGRELVAIEVQIPRSMYTMFSRLEYFRALIGPLQLGVDFFNLDCSQALLLDAVSVLLQDVLGTVELALSLGESYGSVVVLKDDNRLLW